MKLPTFIGSGEMLENSREAFASASLTTLKTLTVWITVKCGKFLRDMGVPDHLACLLRNMYAGQETNFRTGHGTKNWFKIGNGVH